MKTVLDAWALLAYLQHEEPAATRVVEVLREAQSKRAELFASIINVGEVYYSVGRRHGLETADETLEELRLLPITIVRADQDTVLNAARLKMKHSLSYADAFAAATANALKATLMTGDPELIEMHRVVKVETLTRD
ncbi:MAG: type II toxin-antitoxin system VapC family toxin [Deltaproteobacteria bacterium]|nr:type II toxin-antitoxin system VapC family toxin [Deltaproteobacteria bacterium]